MKIMSPIEILLLGSIAFAFVCNKVLNESE